MILPVKYFLPMMVLGAGGITVGYHWNAVESIFDKSREGLISDASNTISITKLPFPRAQQGN